MKNCGLYLNNDGQTSSPLRHPSRLDPDVEPTPLCSPQFRLRHVWGPVIWAAVSIHEPRQLVIWGREEGKWGENVWDRVRSVLLLLRISDHFLILWNEARSLVQRVALEPQYETCCRLNLCWRGLLLSMYYQLRLTQQVCKAQRWFFTSLLLSIKLTNIC